MIERVLGIAATIAIVAIGVATLIGLFAPWVPLLELFNHARPALSIAAALVFTGGLLLPLPRRLRWTSAVITVANLVLLAAPLVLAAERIVEPSPRDKQLKLMAFNIGFNDDPLPGLAAIIAEEVPDLVMLEEVPASAVAFLQAQPKINLPYVRSCGSATPCFVTLLSRFPLTDGGVEITGSGPARASGVIEPLPGAKITALALHLDWPLNPQGQADEVTHFISRQSDNRTPIIVAGDFNLTPWSYKLQMLCWRTGLRLHAIWGVTWPTDQQFHVPHPMFLIDHVLTTPDIKAVSFKTGPDLGSDHLPIIAVVDIAGARSGQ